MSATKSKGCDNPYSVKLTPESSGKHGINHAPVPCGRCFNCKQRRIQQWSFRLQKELEVSTSAYFVTLTYDNDHVPIVGGKYPMTLVKNSEQNGKLADSIGRTDRSLQAFFKRLRYYEKEDTVKGDPRLRKVVKNKPIKYYACGEYGSRRFRPHIHIILFNVKYQDSIRKAWSTAKLDKGKTIEFIPFGSIDIDSDVNENNINYTLKYICKTDGKVGSGNRDHRIPEFSLMSKGIGANFITNEIETFYNRRLDISYVVNNQGYKIPIPKYYINKMMTEETKEDRIGYIARGVAEAEENDNRTEGQKQLAKYVREKNKNNYAKRMHD